MQTILKGLISGRDRGIPAMRFETIRDRSESSRPCATTENMGLYLVNFDDVSFTILYFGNHNLLPAVLSLSETLLE